MARRVLHSLFRRLREAIHRLATATAFRLKPEATLR